MMAMSSLPNTYNLHSMPCATNDNTLTGNINYAFCPLQHTIKPLSMGREGCVGDICTCSSLAPQPCTLRACISVASKHLLTRQAKHSAALSPLRAAGQRRNAFTWWQNLPYYGGGTGLGTEWAWRRTGMGKLARGDARRWWADGRAASWAPCRAGGRGRSGAA